MTDESVANIVGKKKGGRGGLVVALYTHGNGVCLSTRGVHRYAAGVWHMGEG